MEVRTTGVPVIGARELRRAADILRRYKQGRQNLERRIIADEDWWKLRQWRQFADKGNPNDDRPASGWLFNVIMGKHADAIAAYPGPNIRPREPDDRMEAQMLSSILPCILEQNDFEEVYSDTCWQKMKQGTGIWGVYWDQDKLGGLGDISIRPVNVLNLFWEPGVTDIQDSPHFFSTELVDNDKLLATLKRLRDLGNTLIVVEHDEDTMRAADYLIDIGPGAGVHGGGGGRRHAGGGHGQPQQPYRPVFKRQKVHSRAGDPPSRQRRVPYRPGRGGKQPAPYRRVRPPGDLHLRHRRVRLRQVLPGQRDHLQAPGGGPEPHEGPARQA